MEAAETYTFQILTDEEIVLCLQELQIPFKGGELKAPSKGPVRSVYEYFTSILLGQDKEDPPTAVAAAMEVLDFPELYDAGIEQMRFRKRLYVCYV